MGFIDKNGEWVIKPRFVGGDLRGFKNGIFNAAESDTEGGYINKKGEYVRKHIICED